MIYSLLKAYSRLCIRIYCRRVCINKPGILQQEGPLLIAANHPNSFLDGIILTTLFDHQVYSLARGDAFKHRYMNRILRWMRLLPVYRTSEGVENLEHNYTTFAACQETFRQKGIVLIFSEGLCQNEWHLRPLKKGTARLATTAWKKGIPLTVLPLGINYSSFKSFGKEVHLNFGEPIVAIDLEDTEGRQLVQFNSLLETQLQELVYEIVDNDQATVKKIFSIRKEARFYTLLLPALAGWLLHAPLYYSCMFVPETRFKHSGHYDSMQTALLMMIYIIYWPLLSLLAGFLVGWPYGIIALLALPFTAWAAVQVKYEAGW